MADDRLYGKVAVVTGAGDGIGLGIARRFANAGGAVVIAEYNGVKGEAAAGSIRDSGGKALFVECDVTKRDQMEAAVQAAVDQFGSIDILVNNAYPGLPATSIESKTDENYHRDLAINLFGPQWAMLKAFPYMKAKRWGRIINICSLNGVNAHIGTAEYNVSKEALRAYTRSAAREWARHGICANAICPAAVSSSFRSMAEAQPEMMKAAEAINPMGRMGDPEKDIGGVALFLASDDAGYFTGNTLFVDGGAHINGTPWIPEFFLEEDA